MIRQVFELIAKHNECLWSVIVVFAIGACTPAAVPDKPRQALSPPAPRARTAPSAPVPTQVSAVPSMAQTSEDDGTEPPPTIIRGAQVIAEIRADAERQGAFQVMPFDDRIWIAACSVSPFGCSRPQVRELRGDRWVAPNVGLRGLPTLGVVNLYALPDLPYKRWVSHEHNRPWGDPRAECIYDNLMQGTRDIAGTTGSFPDQTWLVVRTSLSHGGLPVDELYHWRRGQWQRVLRAKNYGDTIVSAVPWGNGIAVARRQGYFDSFRHDVLYLTRQTQQQLLGPQVADVLLTVRGGALVGVMGTSNPGQVGPISNIQVTRWKSPNAAPESHTIPIAQVEDSTPLEVKLGSRLEITWNEATPGPAKAKKVTVDLDGDLGFGSETLPPPAREAPATLVTLPPPFDGDVAPEQEWNVRGRHLWLVRVGESHSRYVLLSDQPAPKWTPTPLVVAAPKVVQCEHLPQQPRPANSKKALDFHE
jgi:hypothetical protein